MLTIPIAAALGASSLTAITPLTDRSVFAGVEHTLLDFETRGDSVTPINLFSNSAVLIPNDEYISSGILFADTVAVVHLNETTAFWLAHITQGSPENALGASNSSIYTINFLNDVHSVGFEMVFGRLGFSQPPRVQAFDDLDNLLGEIAFDSTFIDGTTGFSNENGYGFMGLSSTTAIAKITFNNMFFAVIDDLHFSAAAVPSPGVMWLALPMVGVGVRRRRGR